MSVHGLFGDSERLPGKQAGLGLDDGSGLRVVNAEFLNEESFNWDLFSGFESMRVLTYSASISAIVRMLDDYSSKAFGCIFGYEGTLRDIKDILAFQKVAVGDTRIAIMGLKDDRHVHVLEKVYAGLATFRVLRKQIAHSKIYLLSNPDGRTRVVIGSANLSERAFSGTQSETLVKFDDDDEAWCHYSRMLDEIRDLASDEISLPEDRIINAEIEITETPAISDLSATLVIEPTQAEEIHLTAPAQVMRVEKVLSVIGPGLSAAIPGTRSGRQRITPEIKMEISRIRLVKPAEEADNRYFRLTGPMVQLCYQANNSLWSGIGIRSMWMRHCFWNILRTTRTRSKEM
jgi:hypothetical protein